MNRSESSDGQEEAILEFDHNVIEHLGIRLYQNKIPNVLAELVANSWDADATTVKLFTNEGKGSPFVAVWDDGSGMSFEEIRTRYLVVGKPKRKTPKDRSPGGRAPMGRKGIGKLAPFGIARKVDVISVKSDHLNWFTLELSALLASGPGFSKYAPPFFARQVSQSDGWIAPQGHPQNVLISRFLSETGRLEIPQGTLILLSNLTTNRLIFDKDIADGLVDKFSVILARPDFKVLVNDVEIDPATSLPSFELRIPADEPYSIEHVGGKEVRFWAGFVGSATWSSDQAGVGVFVHGKIGQDRPFYFGARGKEIFQRYLYAVVEADWLDELDHDLISTDRTSINWSDPAAEKLREWGAKKVLSWLDSYLKHRSANHLTEVKMAAAEQRIAHLIPSFSRLENDAIDNLVSEATKELGKGQESARNELLGAVSKAWVNLPSRHLVTELWGKLSATADAGSFSAILEKLQEHSVPEAMGLAMTFAQRAYALSVLTELVHKKSETNLQHLIEDFPWIIQPRGDLLTANQWLKTTIERTALELGEEDADRAGRIIKGMSEKERADFVFLADASAKTILIVEIKAPNAELNQNNRRQLVDYLDYTEQFHSSSQIKGLLIGRMPSPPINVHDARITATSWDQILLECRSAYVNLLASMLDKADPDPTDTRIKLVHEFGGEAVWSLLRNLAKSDERLNALMDKHSRLLTT